MANTDVSSRDVTVDTADGPMRVYEAIPSSTPTGAVVVIQEAFGVNGHIEDVTRRLASAGFYAVAPDLFHRSGPGAVVEYGKFDEVIQHLSKITGDATILTDVDAALDYLRAAGYGDSRIGIVGFCFGGRVSFLVSLRRALGAGVGFYGGGIVTGRFPQFPALIGKAGALQTPWLGLFGDEDGSIPVDDVEQLRTALQDAPVATDIVRYPGAPHGFNCDQRPEFRAEAAADAWKRTLGWFGSRLR